MLSIREFCSYGFAALAVITLSHSVCAADPPCSLPCVTAKSAKPTLSGGDEAINLTPSALQANVLGSQFVRDAATGMGGILLESGVAGLTFEHLRITSDNTLSFMIIPILADNAGGLFTRPWLATPIANGVSLDWQPGAPTLGQAVPDANAPGGVGYYKLILELDPAANLGLNLTAFDAATFTIQAVPEPGAHLWGMALLLGGALLLRRIRPRQQDRTGS